QPPFGRHRAEGAVSLVQKALVGHRLDLVRLAHDCSPPGVPAFDRVPGVEIAVVAHVEIEIAVEVDIAPRGTRTPETVETDRRTSHVDEGAIPLVFQQGIGADIGYHDVVEPVVVVVADRNPLAVATLDDLRGPGDNL